VESGAAVARCPSTIIVVPRVVRKKSIKMVKVHVKCLKCGDIDTLQMGALHAAGSFFMGKVHTAIPDSHSELRKLMEERKSGWNTYSDTLCKEVAERGYKPCNMSCDGLMKVSLFG